MLEKELDHLFTPVIEDLGYTYWGGEYFAQGKHSLLRIYIEHERGIGIEDCELVSRQISSLLDVEDPIAGNYRLEISSPGIPRPLFYPWQYQLYVGQDVNIKLSKPFAGKRNISGTILSAEDNALRLKIGDEDQEFLISNIVKAYLTV